MFLQHDITGAVPTKRSGPSQASHLPNQQYAATFGPMCKISWESARGFPVAELEAQSRVSASSETGNEELTQSVAEMEALIKAKDEEIKTLRGKKPDFSELEKEKEEASQRMQDLEVKNSELEKQVQTAEIALASSQDSRNRAQSAVQKVIETLDVKIYDLSDLRQNLAKLLED
ncbi:unnamed protein product [Leuciscus chuanchicus]